MKRTYTRSAVIILVVRVALALLLIVSGALVLASADGVWWQALAAGLYVLAGYFIGTTAGDLAR